jgi:lysophospholipid acyltransferase (LPLAT)-like uncharacterized protein
MGTPAFIKTISRTDILRAFLCFVGSIYIRFVHISGKWSIENNSIPDNFIAKGKPFITCFWHGRMLMMSYAWPYKTALHMLISSHADGQFIAKTINHLGFKSLEGSTKHGGSAAMRAMIRILRSGGYIGITPDGPRGPLMRASNGAITLAKLTGAPILPISYSVSSWKIFQSWDRFILPMPFTKGTFIWGEAIEISKDANDTELKTAKDKLEKNLMEITRKADKIFGQTTPCTK